jgi:hypothetical protein
MLPVG